MTIFKKSDFFIKEKPGKSYILKKKLKVHKYCTSDGTAKNIRIYTHKSKGSSLSSPLSEIAAH